LFSLGFSAKTRFTESSKKAHEGKLEEMLAFQPKCSGFTTTGLTKWLKHHRKNACSDVVPQFFF